jgi:hypothetical protein
MTGESRQNPFAEIYEDSVFGHRFLAECCATDGNVAMLRTTDISEEGRIEYSTMSLARLDQSKLSQHVPQFLPLPVRARAEGRAIRGHGRGDGGDVSGWIRGDGER